MDSQARRLSMLLVPSIPWRSNWIAFIPGDGPDPRGVCDLLARDHAIDTTLIDPTGFPWNPFAGRHQVFAGLDPARALSMLSRHRRADIVLACFEPGAALLLALRGLAGFRPRIAITDIGLTEHWKIRERLLDFVVPRADAIYPLGSNQVTYIRRRWRTQATVQFIHQHVDSTFYHPGPPAPDGPVLSVGDDQGRDFPTLLAAFAGLSTPLLIKSSLVAPQGLPANVQVLRDRLAWRQYRDLFQRARFVVVPLQPMVTASGVGTVLEAMAMGKATISSDSPGIRDYVIADETALVVPCGDVVALKSAIERLLREPQTCVRLGAAARRFVEQHCSYAAHAAKCATALRALVTPSAALA